ncbi:hypothetical protein LIA77_07572 [Sarocladium implicatum]|nr:hypothetical protein LIA77_07572 [Sarocladium implicatum]
MLAIDYLKRCRHESVCKQIDQGNKRDGPCSQTQVPVERYSAVINKNKGEQLAALARARHVVSCRRCLVPKAMAICVKQRRLLMPSSPEILIDNVRKLISVSPFPRRDRASQASSLITGMGIQEYEKPCGFSYHSIYHEPGVCSVDELGICKSWDLQTIHLGLRHCNLKRRRLD